ncbi:MAG: iron-sulfur cluster-binding domain-containing protein [Spirochaetales bacterium]|nr:iron-sulfur cluster-binding domain-containing protein [Spirochaetales bacterium]
MKLTVKGGIRDTVHFILNMHSRNRIFNREKALRLPAGPLIILAERLHPACLRLRIESIKRETPNCFTYRLVPVPVSNPSGTDHPLVRERIPFFRAGQHITVKTQINSKPASRPFSICSTPAEALKGNYYEITVEKMDNGFFSKYAVENWRKGDVLSASGPLGNLYYVPVRDGNRIVFIAGGSGVTPFSSIIRDTLKQYSSTSILLIYGAKNEEEIPYYKEFKELQSVYSDRFKLAVVCSEPKEEWNGAKGFITEGFLNKTIGSPKDKTFFICGPSDMQKLLDSAFSKWNLLAKQIRRENYGGLEPADNYWHTGQKTSQRIKAKSFTVTVYKNGKTTSIKTDPEETVLVALERAGLDSPVQCRSGTCGWCRSRLISGNLIVPEKSDGRRGADKKFGYFHPCASYPVSDLEVSVPNSPLH